MAILGGAGNVAGSNPAGTGTSLNYVGDHCFGYSGQLAIPGSATTMLQFETGGQYIVAKVLFQSNNSTADDYTATVSMNDEKVSEVFIQNTGQLYPYGSVPLNLVIPPYTKVEIFMENKSSSSGYTWYATITGRVY